MIDGAGLRPSAPAHVGRLRYWRLVARRSARHCIQQVVQARPRRNQRAPRVARPQVLGVLQKDCLLLLGQDPIGLSINAKNVFGRPQAMTERPRRILPTPPKGLLALASWALCCNTAVDPHGTNGANMLGKYGILI